jgi:ABC-type dipeptide/oligopeptide/nickel transport system ATPase subunit
MKIIISENQLRLLNEALGVPENILDAADMLYDVVEQDIKSIDSIQDEYKFDGIIEFELGDKKKVKIDSYELKVNIETIDGEEGVLDIISMGMGGAFGFNRDVYMKETEPSTTLELTITFAVGENWEPEGLIRKMEEERDEHVSSLAHEIKHKYDKQSKQFGLMGPDAEYQATQRRGNFGIPAIDRVFYRYMYYIHAIENLVRPTEVAYTMKRKNITKSQFKEFLENNRVYRELVEIKNFTFDDFISQLKEQEERLDKLIEHVGQDPYLFFHPNMTVDEKINKVLEIAYIDLVNNRMELFITMTEHSYDDFLKFGLQLGLLPDGAKEKLEGLNKTNQIRQKFLSQTTKYEKNPTKFFEDEFEKFNYVANKMLKKISKLYAMAKDDEQVSESILNWDLHQRVMEKKYGKRKIETEIRDWKLK